MTAAAFLEHLYHCGFDLRPGPDGTLYVSPASHLTAEDRAQLAEHKPALLAILAGKSLAPRTRGPVDHELWVVRGPEGREETITLGQLKSIVIDQPDVLGWPVRRLEGTAWVTVRDLGIRPSFLGDSKP